MSDAKSVVLSCAGIGSRLGLGQTKALVQIDGRSLIAWQLDLLKTVQDLRIVVGFQARDIVSEVLRYRKDVIFVFNHNYFNTKTGASFYLGARNANEYVIEWDGDLLVHPDDAKKCLEFEGEYVGYSPKSSDEAVFVRTNENGDVLSFSEEGGDYEWTGPACLRRSHVKYTSGNMYNQIEEYLPLKGLKIRAQDIDTYDDYQRAVEFVQSWPRQS
jgi:choline kinase